MDGGTAPVARVAQLPARSRVNPVIGLYAESWRRAGAEVVDHDLYPAPPGRLPSMPLRWAVRSARRLDVVHLHWFQPLYRRSSVPATALAATQLALALAVMRLAGGRLTWTAHNLRPHEPTHPVIDRLVQRAVAALASVVFVESASAGEAVADQHPGTRRKMVVAPLGGYQGVYGPLRPQAEARVELGLDTDAFVILAFGLIRRYKGVEGLIEAFGRADLPAHVVLAIAGEPHTQEVRDDLEDRVARSPARDRIRLALEHVPAEAVPTWFGAANIVALPYEDIFVSSSVLLAWTMQRAVIAPRRGALPLADDARGGVGYDPEEDTGLVSALEDAVGRDWEALGRDGEKLLADRDWDRTGATMVERFAGLAKGGRSR